MNRDRSTHPLFPRVFVERLVFGLILGATQAGIGSDLVIEWNTTIRQVIQSDGAQVVNRANPGWSTRAMAMMNGAIYDAFQAIDRTHQPFLFDSIVGGSASRDAAVNEAAYRILLGTYPQEHSTIQTAYQQQMAAIPDGPQRVQGIALGEQIANAYMGWRNGDHALDMVPYTPGTTVGAWQPDPFHPEQQAWGPQWGMVTPFAIPATDVMMASMSPPSLTSNSYAEAFAQVKAYGAVHSTVRSDAQEKLALFWAYDRPTMGPPPVLFLRNLQEIAEQAGNTPEENARLFAMASVSMADAAIASWDAKFTYNLWRPVTAIQQANLDNNPQTEADPTWRPLGAPGADPSSELDDFTPPFPSWTSGHATMGGALFKTVELFYGTNEFDAIDGISGNNPLFRLTSQEFDDLGNTTMTRSFRSFTQTGPLDIGLENSPEGENGTSRVYLGIHWMFDQVDGIRLGNNVSEYVAETQFQPVPEPSVLSLGMLMVSWGVVFRRTRSL